jgi:hypothetical protein
MSLPTLPTDAKLSMVGWRYHLVNPCPAVLVPAKLGANELQVVVIPKDQLITAVQRSALGGHHLGASAVHDVQRVTPSTA